MDGKDQDTSLKLKKLRERLESLRSVVVAFSGGLDSTFLAKVGHDVLGARCLMVTARSEIHPAREQRDADDLSRRFGFRHVFVDTSELDVPGFAENSPDRCYHCKARMFRKLRETAETEGMERVADGSTPDDLSDFRPGRRAARELEVCAPLLEAGLCKEEIRALSKTMGLPTWNKPSSACLASRIPYGETITAEKLKQVESAEEYVRRLGARQCRVRHHGTMARIEVSPADFGLLTEPGPRKELVTTLRKEGFIYVTLDLAGHRTGSMNEALAKGGGH